MARSPKKIKDIATQESATAPIERDANGYQLDAFGLPVNGPARLRALNGAPDPALADGGADSSVAQDDADTDTDTDTATDEAGNADLSADETGDAQ
jgi:hypothetical protein